MSYQETSTTGYGERLGNSLKGIVTGFVLFIIGTVVLFWNEGNFVKTKKALKEGQSNVVALGDINSINNDLNGKLVHASGLADTKDTLTDEIFGVRELAIALDRKVEYYQWVEESKTESKDKIGGSQENVTTYTYKQKWVDQPVNSSEFKDPAYKGKNFVLSVIENKSSQSNDVTFGAYQLPTFIISSIGGSAPVAMNISEEQKQDWEKSILKNLGEAPANDSNGVKQEYFHVNGNVAYLGKSSANPAIGDVRVTIEKTVPTIISIIAKLNGNTFEPYIAKNGKDISQVANGTLSAESMFQGAHESNKMWTWILRVVGMIIVIIGLKSMFSILSMVLKVLPFLANIVSAGVGLVVTIVGFAWSLIIIALAWLFYRPLVAILLIAAVVGAIIFLKKRAKEKAALANQTTPSSEA